MKCPELPLSADTLSLQLVDTSGDIEFILRGTRISLQMDKSADNRGDVKSVDSDTTATNFFICDEFQL